MNFRNICLLPFLLLCALPLSAQRESVTGRIIDSESREAMVKATVQLYRIRNNKDTTFVGGAFSNERGAFQFNNVSSGTYFLNVTYLG